MGQGVLAPAKVGAARHRRKEVVPRSRSLRARPALLVDLSRSAAEGMAEGREAFVATRNIGSALVAFLACALLKDEQFTDARCTQAGRAWVATAPRTLRRADLEPRQTPRSVHRISCREEAVGLPRPHGSNNASCGAECGSGARRVTAKRGTRNVR